MFKDRLKELRKKAGLSQQKFAEHINSAQTTIAGWENGAREPDFQMLSRIADHFKVSVDFLLGANDINPEDRSYAFKNGAGFYYVYGGLAGIMEDFERLDEADKKNLLSYARFLLSADKYKPPVPISLDDYDAPVYEVTVDEGGDPDGDSETSDT